jgi:Xaa-Pro aminopeptidase
MDKAALWTDGRYYLQAEQQLDADCYVVMRDGLADTPSIAKWLVDVVGSNGRVGVDPRSISISM